jgi:competence protein ComEC
VLNKEIPFLRVGLSICAGIILGQYLEPGIFFLAASFLILISVFLFSLNFNKSPINYVYGYFLTFALFVSGLLLYSLEKARLSDLESGPATYICTVSEFPEEKANSYRLTVRLKIKITENGNIPLNGSLLLNAHKDSTIATLLPGDFLKIRCSVTPVVNRGNPEEFDYRFYLENRGIKYSGFISSENIEIHFAPSYRKLKDKALIIREKIIDMYEKRGINGERLALVAAITLGQKNMLDQEQKQNFIKAGVMHIMAVSGLHAVIISMFILNLLFFLKRRFNYLRILLTVLLLWSFAFVTGLTASVLRATLMFTFIQTGTLIRRNVNSINSVLASAVILLIIQPSVLFDAGFLLSYSAVIFIICFYQDLYLKPGFKSWLADKIWQSVAVTLLAQAGTLTLTISAFNRFPTWFILTNLIIVPISSFLIIIGCMIPLTYPIEFISHPLAMLLSWLTGVTEMLAEKAASLPFSTIENLGMGPLESILLFMAIFLFMLFLFNRRSFPVLYPIAFLLLFFLTDSIRDISVRTSNELIVYNTSGAGAIGIRTGKILDLYTNSELPQPEVIRHCASGRLRIRQHSLNEKFTLISTADKRILICNSLNDKLLQTAKPDHIILTGSSTGNTREIHSDYKAGSLILTSAVPSGYYRNYRTQFQSTDTIHYVKKSGAFRVRW